MQIGSAGYLVLYSNHSLALNIVYNVFLEPL